MSTADVGQTSSQTERIGCQSLKSLVGGHAFQCNLQYFGLYHFFHNGPKAFTTNILLFSASPVWWFVCLLSSQLKLYGFGLLFGQKKTCSFTLVLNWKSFFPCYWDFLDQKLCGIFDNENDCFAVITGQQKDHSDKYRNILENVFK